MGWVDGHFRKGRWVRGHHRNSPGSTDPAAEKQAWIAVAILFGGGAALLFSGCVFVVAFAQCESNRTIAPSPDPALAEAAAREEQARQELIERAAAAERAKGAQQRQAPKPRASASGMGALPEVPF
jgi:hypothetical protein